MMRPYIFETGAKIIKLILMDIHKRNLKEEIIKT